MILVVKHQKLQIKILMMLSLQYELPDGTKRQYKCNGLVETARKQMIPDLKITEEKYFKERYKVTLKHPGLPCLWLGSHQ